MRVVKDGEEVEGKIADLLRHPHPHMSRKDWTEALVIWILLTGVGFVQIKRLGKGKEINYLELLNPDRVRVVPSVRDDVLDRVEVLASGHNWVPVPPEDVIVMSFTDPTRPGVGGVSPLEAMATVIDGDNKINQRVYNVLKNNNIPSGILELADPVTDDQRRGIKDAFLQMRAEAGDGGVLITTKGVSFSPLSEDGGQEVDFIESSRRNRDTIVAGFGIPVTAVSGDKATYNNARTSRRTFWESAVLPVLTEIADSLTYGLHEVLEDGEEIKFDTSSIKDLQESRKEQVQVAKDLVSIGVELETALDMAGLEFPKGLKEQAKEPKAEADGEQKRAVQAHGATRPHALLRASDQRNIERENEAVDDLAETLSVGYAMALSFDFEKIQASLNALDYTPDALRAILYADSSYWDEVIENHYLQQGVVSYKDVAIQTRADGDDVAEIQRSLKDLLDREGTILIEKSLILDSTARAVITLVQETLEDGLSLGALQDKLTSSDIDSPARVLRIARTIGGSAQSLAQTQSALDSGATVKKWFAVVDKVTRDNHRLMHLRTAPIDGVYATYPGPIKPRRPLDIRLGAKDRVNCRCAQLFE
jgi:HK97 family phage portal protein